MASTPRRVVVGVGYLPGDPRGGVTMTHRVADACEVALRSLGFAARGGRHHRLELRRENVQLEVVRGAAHHGTETARAFSRRLAQADLAFYVGHGRNGSGPDFDRDVAATWVVAGGAERTFSDIHALESHIRRYYRHQDPVAVLRHALATGRCRLRPQLDGNVWIGDPRHSFGGAAYRLALSSDLGAPVVPARTSTGGRRVLAFYACNSMRYVRALRKLGLVDADDDLLVTGRDVSSGAEAEVLGALVSGWLAGEDGSALRHSMGRQMKLHEPDYPDNPFRLRHGASHPAR